MRVAMVGLRGLYGPVGGIEAALDALVPRLADRGLELDVFCRSRYQRLPTRLRPGVRLVNIPTVYTKHLETFVYTALAQLRPGDVDVVHFHALGPTLFAPFPRLRGIKVVSTIHGLDWERPKWGPVARAALRTGGWLSATVPHATVVVSHTLQAHYLARYDRHTHVIPNGVTERPSRPLNRLRRFGLEPEGFLLFLGRLVPDKGCDLLLEAFKQVPTDLRLVLAGSGPESDPYTARLRAMAARDPRVVMTGPLEGAEKEEALSQAACVVMPSRVEGLSVALLEAMEQARCPVVSDIPANLEAIGGLEPGEATGFTFRSGSVQDLARALEHVLREPWGRERMGLRAQTRVRQVYSWNTAADQLIQVYGSLHR